MKVRQPIVLSVLRDTETGSFVSGSDMSNSIKTLRTDASIENAQFFAELDDIEIYLDGVVTPSRYETVNVRVNDISIL